MQLEAMYGPLDAAAVAGLELLEAGSLLLAAGSGELAAGS